MNDTKNSQHFLGNFNTRTINVEESAKPEDTAKIAFFGCFVPLILFLLLCTLSYLSMTCTRQARLLSKFPGYVKLPFIGSLWVGIMGGPRVWEYAVARGADKFGRRFVFWSFLHKPYVVLLEADSVQKIISTSKFLEKGSDYKNFTWLFGDGLITSKVSIWRKDRKLLTPFFKYQKIVGFLPIFNKNSKILVQILEETFDETNQHVNLHPILSKATMDSINESALGKQSSFQREIQDNGFLEVFQKALDLIRLRTTKPWMVGVPFIWNLLGYEEEQNEIRTEIRKTVFQAVKTRRKQKAETDDEKNVIVDALLDSKTEQEIEGHVNSIFGAGFETTASGSNFTLFLLALNPECLANVLQEIDKVFGSDENEERYRDVTLDDLAELHYLEMCIKESLRLFPPVPLLIRRVDEDVPIDGDLIIPKGCDVFFCLHALHKDPQHFPEPEEFIPERHLPEETAKRHPYAYMPFSLGPRNCIGHKYAMFQMKIILAHILRKFIVSTTQKRETIGAVYSLVLEPTPAIKLKLVPRKHVANE